MHSLTNIRQLWASPTVNQSVLILLALLGVTIPCWFFHVLEFTTPLILGVIAAALSESDDSFSRRVKVQLLTLICFIITTFSIEILFNSPWLFATGLFISSIIFIMIGAIGPRYTRIAFSSLLMAVYAMLGAHQSVNLWLQPTLLLSGAIWYFLLSAVWYSIAPMRPVQQNLANVFTSLSIYLKNKQFLFHPSSKLSLQSHRITEARLNAKTVEALNETKQIFLARSQRGLVDAPSDRFLKIYFWAQDIHERLSSSHYRYQDLSESFRYSDIMFRFKHLLEVQSMACCNIADAIRTGTEYQHAEASKQALEELQDSLSYLKKKHISDQQPLLSQLEFLFHNLLTVEKLLSNVSNPDLIHSEDEGILDDTEVYSFHDMWLRVKANFNPTSLLFRHAVRLSIALTVGYGIIQFSNYGQGYWILLTTLFVCQPNYSATQQKLVSRIAGTLIGLLSGIALLALFPSQLSQLVFIVLSGVAFFIFRVNNYRYATAFITILVLFCFNQQGDGYAVILPRLMDTIIGCLLAAGAVSYILPDWQSGRLNRIMAQSIAANKNYLAQIIGQYRIGKKNDLTYRIARRHAHNQASNLSTAITNMMAEPGKHRLSPDDSFRFLTLNHALLSYISALGAHRQRITHSLNHFLILKAHREIHTSLDTLCHRLQNKGLQNKDWQDKADTESEIKVAHEIKAREDNTGTSESQFRHSLRNSKEQSSATMVLQQLDLISDILPEFHRLTNQFTGEPC